VAKSNAFGNATVLHNTARSLGALKLKQGPVGILWSDEMPENALGYKGCGGGCIMVLFAQVAAKGKQAAFDRDNFGCFGGGFVWALESSAISFLWEELVPWAKTC
jgi:hypothetical protein